MLESRIKELERQFRGESNVNIEENNVKVPDRVQEAVEIEKEKFAETVQAAVAEALKIIEERTL